MQSVSNPIVEVLERSSEVTYLALPSPDRHAHVIDLSLHVPCFRHWFFDRFREIVSFFDPELINELTSEALPIDMVFVDLWHTMVTISV